ncbi:MAG: ribosome recycling factor [Acutalibacteraceae bacterium]|jgi:ribosome recycling factor|nr:ribosome recycling factor [Acutalibacteraceae bacterium]HJB61142.1 ribosome recycling factor [Candidatus Ruminococcus gallistercoris]
MKEVLAKAESKMNKTIQKLEGDYAAIRAGRANPAVLDKVTVDYYGAPTPINQLAAVSVTEARVLTIQPWDGSVCRAIERAIQTSDIGINPQSDGKTIRLIFPPLTEEKRKEIVKDVSKMAEDAKIALRSIRRDAIEKLKAMKKDGELTEDDLKQAEKKAQDITDKSTKIVDERSAAKQKEVLTI